MLCLCTAPAIATNYNFANYSIFFRLNALPCCRCFGSPPPPSFPLLLLDPSSFSLSLLLKVTPQDLYMAEMVRLLASFQYGAFAITLLLQDSPAPAPAPAPTPAPAAAPAPAIQLFACLPPAPSPDPLQLGGLATGLNDPSDRNRS